MTLQQFKTRLLMLDLTLLRRTAGKAYEVPHYWSLSHNGTTIGLLFEEPTAPRYEAGLNTVVGHLYRIDNGSIPSPNSIPVVSATRKYYSYDSMFGALLAELEVRNNFGRTA